jgi:hypothetical protein
VTSDKFLSCLCCLCINLIIYYFLHCNRQSRMATGKMSRRHDRAETLVEAALGVLNTADPFEKARLGNSVASLWLQGAITQPYDPSLDLPVPDRPARFSNVRALQLPQMLSLNILSLII